MTDQERWQHLMGKVAMTEVVCAALLEILVKHMTDAQAVDLGVRLGEMVDAAYEDAPDDVRANAKAGLGILMQRIGAAPVGLSH